jgi:hypothetical protein
MTAGLKGVSREMIRTIFRWLTGPTIVAVATAFAIMAPHSQASADGLPFKPPKGWVSVQVPAGLIGKWVEPGDAGFHQSVSVYGHAFSGTLADYYVIDLKSLKAHYPGGDLAVSEDTTVCSDHPAKYVSYGLDTSAGALIVEQIMTVERSAAYVVTYVRLASQSSEPAARESMTTICGI